MSESVQPLSLFLARSLTCPSRSPAPPHNPSTPSPKRRAPPHRRRCLCIREFGCAVQSSGWLRQSARDDGAARARSGGGRRGRARRAQAQACRPARPAPASPLRLPLPSSRLATLFLCSAAPPPRTGCTAARCKHAQRVSPLRLAALRLKLLRSDVHASARDPIRRDHHRMIQNVPPPVDVPVLVNGCRCLRSNWCGAVS